MGPNCSDDSNSCVRGLVVVEFGGQDGRKVMLCESIGDSLVGCDSGGGGEFIISL